MLIHMKDGTMLDVERDLQDEIKTPLRGGALWEPWVRDLLVQYVRPGSTVVDVGAYIGLHTILMSRLVGPEGKVLAFEPCEKSCQELVANLKLNEGCSNVMALHMALGSVTGSGENRAQLKNNEGSNRVWRTMDLSGRIRIEPLDAFDLEDVSLIKIDAEGSEAMVLEGARATILKNRPVLVIEIHGGLPKGRAQRETVARCFQLLREFGYAEPSKFAHHDYLALPL